MLLLAPNVLLFVAFIGGAAIAMIWSLLAVGILQSITAGMAFAAIMLWVREVIIRRSDKEIMQNCLLALKDAYEEISVEETVFKPNKNQSSKSIKAQEEEAEPNQNNVQANKFDDNAVSNIDDLIKPEHIGLGELPNNSKTIRNESAKSNEKGINELMKIYTGLSEKAPDWGDDNLENDLISQTYDEDLEEDEKVADSYESILTKQNRQKGHVAKANDTLRNLDPSRVTRLARTPAQREMLEENNPTSSLDLEKIELEYQNIVSLADRKECFKECFARIRDEAGELLSPSQFLNGINKLGLMPSLDKLMLKLVAKEVSKVGKSLKNNTYFCNLSSSSLTNPGFWDNWRELSSSRPTLYNSIIFELPQDEMLWVVKMITNQKNIALLKDNINLHKIKFSIDHVSDFKSTLLAMDKININYFKVPLPTIMQTVDLNIIRKFVSEMQSTGAIGIATMLDNEQDAMYANDLGFKYAQGFVFNETTTELKNAVG